MLGTLMWLRSMLYDNNEHRESSWFFSVGRVSWSAVSFYTHLLLLWTYLLCRIRTHVVPEHFHRVTATAAASHSHIVHIIIIIKCRGKGDENKPLMCAPACRLAGMVCDGISFAELRASYYIGTYRCTNQSSLNISQPERVQCWRSLRNEHIVLYACI